MIYLLDRPRFTMCARCDVTMTSEFIGAPA